MKHIIASLTALSINAAAFSAHADSGDLLWSYKTGAENWGSIQIKDHTIYLGSDNGQFYAFDIERPHKKWSFETAGLIRGKPAIWNHMILFSSDDGFLYALNRWSGQLLWQVDLGDSQVIRNLPANHAPWDFDYAKSSPVINENSVYIGTGNGELLALELISGAVKWRYSAGARIRSTPSVAGQFVVFSDWQGNTLAVDKHTGVKKWLHKAEAAIISDPLIAEGKVLIGARDQFLYALDVHSGQEVWKLQFPGGSWVDSSAVKGEAPGVFYIGSSDANLLFKGNLTNGDIIWQVSTQGWSWGAPTVKNGTVYIGAVGHDEPWWQETKRQFLAVDAITGETKWQYTPALIDGFIHGGVHGTPGVAYGKVVVPDLDGYIHIFEE